MSACCALLGLEKIVMFSFYAQHDDVRCQYIKISSLLDQQTDWSILRHCLNSSVMLIIADEDVLCFSVG